MKKFIFLIVVAITQIAFASTYDIKNAKVGSTVVNNFNYVDLGIVEGHAALVINEFESDYIYKFIVGMDSTGAIYDSLMTHLNGNDHLGHFRATIENYSFKTREYIKKVAIKAVKSDLEYTSLNLYTYDSDNNLDNNIPYNINLMPTAFRCDGLAEWATEISLNRLKPKEEDGFYSSNAYALLRGVIPMDITQSPIDAIGTPDAPTLTKTDTDVNASFPAVSGAWSEALYSLYRSTVQSPYVSDLVYCGKKRSYKDEITDDMEGEYFYYLKIGERTASCSNAESDFSDFSEFSEYSSVLINKCKSPELFEVVSQTDVNTSDWRVSVINLETNKTQEGVLPFNLNGSLYQLKNDEWVLASCDGKAYTTTWEGSQGIYQLDNPQEEQIVFNRFQYNSEENLTIIDTKTSLLWDNSTYFDNWTDASSYCQELVSDSYENWRMPTFDELKSIATPSTSNHVYDEFFTALNTTPYGYWSSMTFTFWTYWGYETDSLVLSYINASAIWIDTQYNMNFMCVQQL